MRRAAELPLDLGEIAEALAPLAGLVMVMANGVVWWCVLGGAS